MIKILKNKGFKQFIIKSIMFLIIFIGIQIFIDYYFSQTQFFQNNLRIPDIFKILPFILRLTLVNAFIFGAVVFFILTYRKIINIKEFKFDKKQFLFLFTSLLFLIFQYTFKYIIHNNLEYFSEATIFWGIIKLMINILFGINLIIFIYGIELTKYFINEYKKEILLSIGLSIAFFFVMLLVQNLWTYFSSAISEILYRIFSLFFDNVTYKPFVTSFTMTEGGGPLLGINNFRALVGKPCSGIDSFLLFTSLYSLIFILDYKKLKKPLAIALFFVGVIGMFLTNALRILLLFIVGAYVDPKFAIGMFHTNAGWILFIVYFFVFWWIASKYVYKKKP